MVCQGWLRRCWRNKPVRKVFTRKRRPHVHSCFVSSQGGPKLNGDRNKRLRYRCLINNGSCAKQVRARMGSYDEKSSAKTSLFIGKRGLCALYLNFLGPCTSAIRANASVNGCANVEVRQKYAASEHLFRCP